MESRALDSRQSSVGPRRMGVIEKIIFDEMDGLRGMYAKKNCSERPHYQLKQLHPLSLPFVERRTRCILLDLQGLSGCSTNLIRHSSAMHPTARSNHTSREISVEGETRDSTPLLVVSAVSHISVWGLVDPAESASCPWLQVQIVMACIADSLDD